jgi:membrane fusion protein (multidrug efflux system)
MPDGTTKTEIAPTAATEPVRSPRLARRRDKRRGLRFGLMILGVVVVAAGGLAAWLHGGRWASTDDAYVRAAKLLISTDVPGIVAKVDVHEGDVVTAGEILLELDRKPYEIALTGANAELAQTALDIEGIRRDYQRMLADIEAERSNAANAQATFDRYASLLRTENVSRANYDEARFKLQAAQRTIDSLQKQAQTQLAKLNGDPNLPVERHPQWLQIKAKVDEAERQLAHTVIKAPFPGIATQVEATQPGMYLAANTAAFGLVDTSRLWVEANMKETDLTWVKPGAPVEVVIDTYPGKTWPGTVESVAPVSGSEFSVLPAQNSSGNWVKVVQRIAVRVRIDQRPGDPILRAGMSANVEIDTGHTRQLSDLL